jgi:septal ring factor EnvC (AmiA/AmiB activator)
MNLAMGLTRWDSRIERPKMTTPTNGTAQKIGVAIIVICTLVNTADVVLTKFSESQSNYSQFGQQFRDFQASVTAQLSSLQQAVSMLPGEGVTIQNMQDHLHAIDSRLDGLDARLSAVEGQAIETRTKLDNVIQSSQQPLPTRR